MAQWFSFKPKRVLIIYSKSLKNYANFGLVGLPPELYPLQFFFIIADGSLDNSNFNVVEVNKEKYRKACKELRIVPASYFLRNMTNVRLNMAHHGLGPKGTKAMAIGLMVKSLSLYQKLIVL